MNTAIILARGGSKRLPGKNAKILAGKPMVQWTLEAATQAGIFDRIILSTDCDELKKIKFGSNIEIFERSKEFSKDSTTSVDSLIEVIQNYGLDGDITLLQPTSPLRDANDCKEAYKLYKESGAISVISASDCLPESKFKVSVDNNHQVALNGAIYIIDSATLMKKKKLLFEDTVYYMMPIQKSIDVDFLEDFSEAEKFLLKR